MASKSLALKASWPLRWISTFADVMAPPRRYGWSSRRSACGRRFARTLLAPFPVLSVGWRHESDEDRCRDHVMGEWAEAKIQLCGRFVVDIDGYRLEAALPGRRGRALFAYLVLERGRPVPRTELLTAGWGPDAPTEAGSALSVALSKVRHGLGADQLQGRTQIELLLPHATFVDVEAALEGVHRAETCIAQGRWAQAWGPAGIAYHVATRPFLSGSEAPWIDQWRKAPRGGPASRPGVLRRCRPGPGRPGTGPGRGTRQAADRACTVSGDRAPHADGSARAERQRRRGTA